MKCWETRIAAVRHSGGKATSVVVESEGGRTEHPCTHVISSMPLSALVLAMDPPAPAEVRAAATGLGYRDFLTIALVVPESAGAFAVRSRVTVSIVPTLELAY